MGVTGLLQNLKEIQEPSTLEKYRGKTLAIDTYGWLHRGLISCAQELCQDLPTRKYITSILKKVDMLKHFGVEPYFVFDGAPLPTKAETANERRIRREEARERADASFNRGDKKSAWKEYMKAASVTSEMAKSVMTELDQRNIKYIVAPYEADPQMVYLEKIGLVDGILSEDSDLLIFGCKRLITKLKDDSSCIEICRDNFSEVKKIPGLSNYTQEQLRLVAMLSGCDYTKGIANVGLKTAFSLVKKYEHLEKILSALRAEGKFPSEDFLEEVNRANLAFQFQKVYNPIEHELRTLNDYPENLELNYETLENCCGKSYDNDLYYKICSGYIHPYTHEVLVSREQNLTSLKSNSVNFKSTSSRNNILSAARSKTTTISIKNTKGTIDSFFKRSASEVASTHNKRRLSITASFNTEMTLKSKLSPTSKKIKKLVIEERNETISDRKSYFFLKSDHSLKTETNNNSEGQVWDSSLISGDSDIDDFSSPLKQSKQNNVLNSVSQTLDEPSQVNGSRGDNLDKGKFELSSCRFKSSDVDEIDDIEESPVKSKIVATEIQTNFTKFAKVLRENFSYDPAQKAVTPNRIPLGRIDVNKNKSNNQKLKVNSSSNTVQANASNKIDRAVDSSVEKSEITLDLIKPRVSLKNFAYRG